jgi:hypothetical protein
MLGQANNQAPIVGPAQAEMWSHNVRKNIC